MATNFPNSPSNGATHVFGGTTYTYNSTKGVWKADKDAVAVSDTPPSNPETGALWFDSSVAKTYIYYNDGSSSQWVQLNPSGGSDGVDGADGADATGDGESPIIYTEPPTSHTLNTDGSTSTVQMQAVDPEGTAITYGLAYANSTNSLPDQLSSATTINQTTGTYTFTPSTATSDEGAFKIRLSASDGIQTSTRFVNVSLVHSFTDLLTTSMVFDHYNATNSGTRFPNAAYGMTYNGLDPNLGTSEFGAHNTTTPSYLAVYIGTDAKAVNQVKFNIHGNHFGDFELQGSNDANTSGTFYNTGTWTALTWASGDNAGTTTINSQNGGGNSSGFAEHSVVTHNYTNHTAYTHYRIVISNVSNYSTGSGSGGWASYGWQFNRV
jgi:hypothetical protein